MEGIQHILEVGCGLGMLGLAVCQGCVVRTYTFTDNSTHVLSLVADNIDCNLGGGICTASDWTEDIQLIGTCSSVISNIEIESDSHPCEQSKKARTRVNNDRNKSTSSDDIECSKSESDEQSVGGACETPSTGNNLLDSDLVLNKHLWCEVNEDVFAYENRDMIQVGRLDWESVTDGDIEKFGPAEIVLAADVVYDVHVIPYLVRVLKLLLTRACRSDRIPPVAYIASTIRNEDTRDQFLIALSSAALSYTPVEPPTLHLFHYDTSIPIEIIKVTV